MPLSADQKNVIRAAISLTGVALVAIIFLRVDEPAPKPVKFESLCSELKVPVPMTLNLNGEAQLGSAQMYGYQAAVDHVTELSPPYLWQALVKHRSHSLTFELAPHRASPDATLTPTGALGRVTVDLKPGATILTHVLNSPTLTIDSTQPHDVHLLMQSTEMSLEEDFYQIPEIFGHSQGVDHLTMHVASVLPGFVLEASSTQPAGSPLRLDLVLAQAAKPLPLLLPGETKGISLQDVKLQMSGVTKPGIQVDGKTPADVIKDGNTELEIESRTGTLTSIEFVPTTGVNGVASLQISGLVEAKSIKQNDHELLPSFVEEILDKPYEERSYWLIALGFGAFALFKVTDRAFEILLKMLLPGG